jgi:predicted nuclease with RNAse H fold
VTWGGVDVGARKGFHVAIVDGERLHGHGQHREVEGVIDAVRACDLVAVDSPRTCALPGKTRRDCERRVLREVPCGIRWTPDEATVRGDNPYYEWIRRGLDLYRALADAQIPAIECFPTASWTRWGGSRNSASRARWSASVLERQGLASVPRRLNQDWRDAIGAALTARAHTAGLTEEFGEIVVPLCRPAPAESRS